jgi:pyruvate formate lyase activating enzyme
MNTNIYHITYTPETSSASLRFWGCNMSCQGCLCKEGIYDHLLKENRLGAGIDEERHKPTRFLDLEEVHSRLSTLNLKRIFLTGEEATIDTHYGEITAEFHDKYHTENILYTNGYFKPDIDNTDCVEVGIKAISDDLHKWYTGRPAKTVKENFITYYEAGVKLTAATIFIPGLVENSEIEKIAQFISDVDKNIPYFVLPYFPAGNNPWRKTRPDEIERAVEQVAKYLNHVSGCQGTEQEILYDVQRIV